jgi:hypothetical protein
MSTEHDPVKAPAYYLFPNGVQLRAITSHLTGNGAQGVQYITRATRLDGNNKGLTTEDLVQDLEKAVEFVVEEIRRLRENKAARDAAMAEVEAAYEEMAVEHAAVHNHGPGEQLGLECPERRMPDGSLRGFCVGWGT